MSSSQPSLATPSTATSPHSLLSSPQIILLALLRIVIGWHFLYEGVAKLLTPGWSAAGYLEVARWWFADQFHWLAGNPTALETVNFLNIWGLIFIGLGLMLGCFTRLASVAGMLLLAVYWIANPPLISLGLNIPTEGSYLLINKNVVEFVALALLLVFPTGRAYGLDALFARWFSRPSTPADPAPTSSTGGLVLPSLKVVGPMGRRQALASLAGLPFLGAFTLALVKKEKWKSYEAQNLVDAVTSASAKTLNVGSLTDLKGELPFGTIGGKQFSRVILGGNLLSGWAHSRDLIYVSSLVKAYHTKEKIFATLLMAEKCGVNTLLTNPILCSLIEEYWKRQIGKIQFISDCAGLVYGQGPAHLMPVDEYHDRVRRAIDYGACACYIQGETADWFIRNNRIDQLEETLELIRQNRVIAGIGAHDLNTVMACVDAGIKPDFWMKTLHHLRYWSAQHPTRHDNVFCAEPDKTIAFMEQLQEPWIAFKTLAAGAIKPDDGFRYAFQNGADFVCVGMYDFQMVKNVNTANEILGEQLVRRRSWQGGPLVA